MVFEGEALTGQMFLPHRPSYNHLPLLVTEAAMPHCTL